MEFDKKTKRYRDKRGRFVSRESVRKVINKTGDTFKREAGRLADSLEKEQITKKQWRDGMASLVKDNLIVTASIGKGGRKQMTKSDWGSVGASVRKEYRYLNRFADALDRLSPAQIKARARQYASAGFIAFSRMTDKINHLIATEAKRFLHASESCSGCRANAGFWMPVAEMPSIGSLTCGHRCRCHIEYR